MKNKINHTNELYFLIEKFMLNENFTDPEKVCAMAICIGGLIGGQLSRTEILLTEIIEIIKLGMTARIEFDSDPSKIL